MRFKPIAIFWPVVVTSIVYLVLYPFSTLFGYDTAARALMGYRWLHDPFFIYVSNGITWVFGPTQCYLNAIATFLIGDPASAARIVSSLAGFATLFPLYGLAKKLYGEEAACYTGLAFPFFTIYSRLAISGNSEPILGFFFVSACYFTVRFVESPGYRWTVIIGILIALASATRYEVWQYIPVFALFMAWSSYKRFRTASLQKVSLFFAIAVAFPIFWLTSHYLLRGNPMDFVVSEANLPRQFGDTWIGSSLYMVAFLPGALLISLSAGGFLVSLIGVVRQIRTSYLSLPLWLIAAYSVFFVQIFIIDRSSMLVARHVQLAGLILLMFFGFGLVSIRQLVSQRIFVIVRAGVFALLIATNLALLPFNKPDSGFKESLRALSPVVQDPDYYDAAAEYLHREADRGATILVDAVWIDTDQKALFVKLYDSWNQIAPYYDDPSGLADEVARIKPDIIVMTPYSLKRQEQLISEDGTFHIEQLALDYCRATEFELFKIYKTCR